MAGIAHFAFGFSSKRIVPTIPLILLLIASEFLDILWFIFYLFGIEKSEAPWSHGFLMSIIWSIVAAILIIIIYRNIKSGIIIGTVVFSHWILDFITHPMGAVMGGQPLPPDLPLIFSNSPKVGLGLYNYSAVVAYIFEFTIFASGLLVYILHTIRIKKQKKLQGIV